MPKKNLFIVHCIDTEGPLYEPMTETFKRINKKFQLNLTPSRGLLKKLQNSEISLPVPKEKVADFCSEDRINYLSSWEEVSEMILDITSEKFRNILKDSNGSGHKYTWMVIDNIGFKNNPRRRAKGLNHVWDKYQSLLKGRATDDCFAWHFHTPDVLERPLIYNSCFTNNDSNEQSLCARLIERNFFPSVFRSGGTIERNDLNFWAEMFFPFDFSSQAFDNERAGGCKIQFDWRHAPHDWSFYHPNFYDYRLPGNMNRAIFRCIYLMDENGFLESKEVEKAFQRAQSGLPTILAVASHDRRDLRVEVNHLRYLIEDNLKKYSDVNFEYATATEAANRVINHSEKNERKNNKPTFTVKRTSNILNIFCDQELFGPAPFLAVKESGRYYRDNVTCEHKKMWQYNIKHPQTIEKIGIAGCNRFGETGVKVVSICD